MRASLLFSSLIVLTAVTVNLLTSPGFPWLIFPVFAVLWWPLSVYYAGKQQPLRYALWGAGLLTAFFVLTYLVASPGAHPWFAYPILAVLWWPLAVWGARAGARKFSVAGGAYAIATLLTVNLLASPGFGWWVYPAFLALWWPFSVLLGQRAKSMGFAASSAAAAILFTLVMHRVHGPASVPWYWFTLLPILWWPVAKALSPRAGQARFALITVVAFLAYYTALSALLFSVSSLLPLFMAVGAAWALYALGISKHRDQPGFAAVNAVLLAAYLVLAHRVLTPDAHAWYWYAFFPLAWWVFALAAKGRALSPRGLALSMATMLAYYGALNLLLSPAVPWVLFLTLPAVGAVIGSACGKARAYLPLSVWMTLAGIAYFAAINLVFTPHALWAVYPAFVLLWWPLSMWLHTRRGTEE